jgi:CBS domain containing-hemolysin-like protein
MLTLHLAILLLLILLNGFFAMAEIALISARPARVQARAAPRACSPPCRSASRSSRC